MLNAESVNPLDYGWKLAPGGTYEPIATKAMIAPESILDLICCNCSVDMEQPCLTLRCSCRKYGFNCLPACGRCHGVNRTNAKQDILEEQDIFEEQGSFD